MEKCEFCSRMVLFGKKDVSNLLGARPVVLGDGDPVKRLELWQEIITDKRQTLRSCLFIIGEKYGNQSKTEKVLFFYKKIRK